MPQETSITSVAHVIQLAVAPVFLISGIAALLAVLTNRLARIIDRARSLTATGEPNPDVQAELDTLTQRAGYVNTGIALATSSVLLIATLIVTLFLGAFLTLNVATMVGVLFVGAMLALVGALVTFLREVRLATRTLRLHHHT